MCAFYGLPGTLKKQFKNVGIQIHRFAGLLKLICKIYIVILYTGNKKSEH